MAASAALFASTAEAHEFIPGVTGFPALMLHPIFLTQQLLAIVTAGLVAGRAISFTAWPFLVSFGLGLAAGQWLATAFPVLILLHLWTATHLVILAAAVTVAASGQLPRALAMSLVVLLAMIIGADIQAEGPALSEKAEAAAATFLTGAILMLAIGWHVSRRMPQWAEILIRIVAAWIAASSLMVLAFLFR